MVNLMQSSNHPSQRQPEPQYKGNPYPVGMPHSLIAATMYEGSVRNFHSNPVSSDIMSKSKSAVSHDPIDLRNVNDLGRYFEPYSDHLLEDKRVDDYRSWTGNRVSKYTACSNIIANEISHLYNRDDLNFDDWQYLLLYNKFKKILTERGTCSPETITFLIYNLINMVKNDLTLRNLLMISSDEYVEEVLTKFVEMALNQRTYGYEYTKPNMDAQKMKSSRKHLQRSSVAASMANTVSKAWGWKDSEHPYPIQAPSQLKPENFYVYGRQLGGSEENINIKDGCIPVPRVVYRSSDVKGSKKTGYPYEGPLVSNTPFGVESPYTGDKPYDGIYSEGKSYSYDSALEPSATYKEQAVAEGAGAAREPEKKKNSKRYGPRGPYKRTLIRMRMREISRMRRHIRNKANESFFLNSEFDNTAKDLKGETTENSNKEEEATKAVESKAKGSEGEPERKSEDKATAQGEAKRPSKMVTRQSTKASESLEQTAKVRAEGVVDNENGRQMAGGKVMPDGLMPKSGTEVHPGMVAMSMSERRREGMMASMMDHTRMEEKRHDLTKGGEWMQPSASKMYAYYTGVQEGYIDPHMIYSSNASTNNSMSSSPIANDYFNDAQSTRLNSETTSEDYNYPEITYAINRQMSIHEVRSKEFGYYDPGKRDMGMYTDGIEYRQLYRPHSTDQMMDMKKGEKEAQPLRKYTTEGPYHTKPIPDSIGERRSTRSGRSPKVIKDLKEKIAVKDLKEKMAAKGAMSHEEKGNAKEINGEKLNGNLEIDEEDKGKKQDYTNGIEGIKKANGINGIDGHKDIRRKGNGIITQRIGINGTDKDHEKEIEIIKDNKIKEVDNSKEIKNKDIDISKIDIDIIGGDEIHDEIENNEDDKVGIIDIDITEKHVTITAGKGKEGGRLEEEKEDAKDIDNNNDIEDKEYANNKDMKDKEYANDKDTKDKEYAENDHNKENEHAKDLDNNNDNMDKEYIENVDHDEKGEEGKRKEENTIWDMVQKHHKSSHAAAPIVVKNANGVNSEAADEKDDMSLLIREHYHISENVPSSQTLPFPNAYKNPKSIKWSYTETKRFYNAIETFGTDLLMVRAFMPEFTDRQVYDKFKLEERKNPQLMQNALQTHKSISLKQYEQRHGKIDAKTHYNPSTDPLLQGEAATTKSGLQLNPDAAEQLDTDAQPKVDDKIINLFM